MRKHDQSSAAEEARRATGAAAERDRKGRFSARRKRATVLRVSQVARDRRPDRPTIAALPRGPQSTSRIYHQLA